MLAYRTVWIVKEGHMQQALELIKAEIDRVTPEKAITRVYTPDLSPNLLVFETVWESAEDNDKFWSDYDQTSPEAAPFWEKWYELAERSVGSERWNVIEWR